MRPYGLVLTTLVLSAVPALAQAPPATSPAGAPGTTGTPAPPPPPGTAPAAPALDRYLDRWEGEMRKVQTLAAQLTRIDKDKTLEMTTKLVGQAQYMKSGTGPSSLNLAQMELRIEGKTDLAEKFVVTGTHLYQFVPSEKVIRYYEMPRPKPGQVADDSFLGFLFGMKAEEAKRRYVLNLAKEDTWYIYVDVTPRFAEDKADFKRARLVLNKDSFLPRQLWFEHPNGNETTWDIPRLQSGVALNRRDFDSPRPPAGWKLVPSVRNPAPAAPAAPVPGTPAPGATAPRPPAPATPGASPAPSVVRPSGM